MSNTLYEELLKKLVTQSEMNTQTLNDVERKLDLHIQKTEYEFDKIKELDETQNKILDEHIAGVNTLKAMHELQKKDVDARLNKLEEPRKWLAQTKKVLVWIASVAGAVAAIQAIFKQ